MSSLQQHLDRHDFAETKVPFRRDCPVCRGERLLGQLPPASLVSPRARAAVTALALATSSAVPGTALGDGQGVAVPAPPSPPPPPANVAAAGGGAAPADTGGSSGAAASAPAEDAPTDAKTSPPDPAPPQPPSTATTDRADDAAARPEAPTQPEHPATGVDAARVDPAPASGDGSSDASRSDGAPADAPAPSTPGPSPPSAPPAAVPAPSASGPTSEAPESPRGHTAVNERSHPSDRRAPRPRQPLADAAPPSGRSARTLSTRDASRADGRHPSPPLAATGSRDGSSGSKKSGAGAAQRAPAGSSHVRHHNNVSDQTTSSYRVQPGDSLWRIAARHLGPDATTAQTAREVDRLWELNQQRIGTGNPNLIFPGQTLTV